jgi:hypothetical protein
MGRALLLFPAFPRFGAAESQGTKEMQKVSYPYVVYHRPFGEAPYPVARFAFKAHAGVFLRGLKANNEDVAEHFYMSEAREVSQELQTA